MSSAELAEFLWELHQSRASSSRFLVFLPGVGDIRNVCEELNEIQDEQGDQLELVQLHSGKKSTIRNTSTGKYASEPLQRADPTRRPAVLGFSIEKPKPTRTLKFENN